MNRVAQKFGRAASTYAGATPIQREVAGRLAERILASGLAPGARAVEFGCGTGRLPLALWSQLAPSLWIATDIAPQMTAEAARALPAEAVTAVMDAARPALRPGFDLACSSLTLQWLPRPAEAVAEWRALVRPGGRLAVATLTDGAFAAWREALTEAGAPTPGPAFPSADEARGWFGAAANVQTFTLTDRHASGLDFLKAARLAGIDAGDGRALGAGVMRRALRTLESRGCEIGYAVMLAVEDV